MLERLFNETVYLGVNIYGIKCAAHTLQLAVRKAMKNSNVAELMKICQLVVKLLRKPRIINEIRSNNLEYFLPRYDCLTRWSSTYLMVSKSGAFVLVFIFSSFNNGSSFVLFSWLTFLNVKQRLNCYKTPKTHSNSFCKNGNNWRRR